MRWFRVATEGTTADGRHIQGSHLEQMARNYNPEKYQARIWLEHYRSIFADGLFPAYGDVTALKCEHNSEGKKELFAQIDPLPEMVKIIQSGQKLYTSVEIDPNFAESGEAYLVGLAFTDSPASLGTERLMFNVQNKEKDHLFSTYNTVDFATEAPKESLLDKVKALFTKHKQEAEANQQANFNAFLTEVEGCFKLAADQIKSLEDKLDVLDKTFAQLEQQFAALTEQEKYLSAQFDPNYTARPMATGGNHDDENLTDC